MNTILTVQLEDLDDNPPEFEFEEKERDRRSEYEFVKGLLNQQSHPGNIRSHR